MTTLSSTAFVPNFFTGVSTEPVIKSPGDETTCGVAVNIKMRSYHNDLYRKPNILSHHILPPVHVLLNISGVDA